jgi:hypothetical protein
MRDYFGHDEEIPAGFQDADIETRELEAAAAETRNLPAFRVIYTDGTSYVTSMSKSTTLENARAYFVDASIEQMDGTCKRVSDVQEIK